MATDPGAQPEDRAERLILVDGMNALGSRPDGWWRDRPRAMIRLVRRLELLAAAEDVDVAVIFDGKPHADVRSTEGSGVEVGFAGTGRNAADRVIAARVREHSTPGEVLVVSSDRRLVASVKAAGGRSTGAGGFISSRLPRDDGQIASPP